MFCLTTSIGNNYHPIRHALNQSPNEDKEQQHWQYILQIRLQPAANLQPLTSIGFLEVIVKAPAPAGSTEKQINQRSSRQKYIADQEILTVQHTSSPNNGHITPDIKAQYTRHTAKQNQNSP